MSKLKFLALLAALALTFSLSGAASAQSDVPPHAFTGIVMVDGKAAPEGTKIVAVVEGEDKGSVIVHERGKYGPLNVEAPNSSDPIIIFKVDNYAAEQAVTWEMGEVTILDLTVDTDDSLSKPSQP